MAATRLERLQVILEVWALALLAGTVFFLHLGSYRLWEPDEARYAEIAREMLSTHQFVVPHLNYVPYVEKPPLLYWLTALSFRVFGLSELAGRLGNAGFALLGVLATYLFGVKAFDNRRAFLAGAIVATSPLYAAMAQVLTTDMTLAVLVDLSLFGFYLHWQEGKSWRWLFYIAMGLAVLDKGPVGAMLPLTVAGVFLWRKGQLRSRIGALGLPSGLAATALIAAPWFVAMATMVPGFVGFYFVGEHLRRFLEFSYSHGQPIYYYVPILAGGMMPWTVIAPLVGWRRGTNSARSFCLIAGAVILVFFSLASSKLIPYILPAVAPFALALADATASALDRQEAGLTPAGLMLTILGMATIAAAVFTPIGGEYFLALRKFIVIAAVVALMGGLASTALFWAGKSWPALGLIALCAGAVIVVAGWGRLAVEPMRSYAALSLAVEHREPEATLICYHRYVQALAFYCRRRVIVVGPHLSELGFGASHSPDREQYFLGSDADLLRLWRRPQRNVLVIDQKDLQRLKGSLGTIQVIASEASKRAVVGADE